MTDPFDDLSTPVEPVTPRRRFARDLRARLVAELGLDPTDVTATGPLPPRRRTMSATTPPTTTPPAATPPATTPTPSSADVPVATAVTPYLAVADGAAALAWYATALGAVEDYRVVGPDGRVGHAEIAIGAARFMLSDEYPEMGVPSPTTLGGTPVTLHLTVPDVDALYARAVAAGATAQSEPADQPHGSRHGTLVDPYGHRWMLSQPLEPFDLEAFRRRTEGSGFEVVGTGPDDTVTAADRPGTGGGLWAAVHYADPLAAIEQLVDVLGFEEQLVVTGPDDRTVVHSELRWPEGGVVQVGTSNPANPFSHPPGGQGLYVITADPDAVWQRCRQAGLEVVREPHAPDHDPEGMSFSVRDHEANIWTFGTYGLDAG